MEFYGGTCDYRFDAECDAGGVESVRVIVVCRGRKRIEKCFVFAFVESRKIA